MTVEKDIEWLGREGEVSVSFRELTGKTVGEEEYTGTVTDLSSDMRFGRLTSDAPIKKLMNLMIEIGGDLYAKVTEVCDDDYVICFTSKPDSFASWSDWK